MGVAILRKADGTILTDMEMEIINVEIESPSYETERVRLDSGRIIEVDRVLNPRNVFFRIYASSNNFGSSYLNRHDIFEKLSNDIVFLTENNMPMYHWELTITDVYDVKRHSPNVFVYDVIGTANKGYASSGVISDGIIKWGEGYQWGGGYQWGENKKLVFFDKQFMFDLPSTVVVDMRKELNCKIYVRGASENGFDITNVTNGSTFSYYGSMKVNDVLIISGESITKNGADVSAQTNYGLIDLSPGNNVFTVTKLANLTVNIETPILKL